MQPSSPPTKPWSAQVLSFKLAPSHCSPSSITPLPQLLQPLVSNWQVDVQPSSPPTKPWSAQVLSFKFAPSHCSPLSISPFPHGSGGAVQALVSNRQAAVQPSVPPSKPRVSQVFSFRFAPSHCSPLSISPLPQLGGGAVQALMSNRQAEVQESSPPPKPWVLQV